MQALTDFSSWFNNPDEADVLLHLSTADPAAAGGQQQRSKTYYAHALILRNASEYFKACLGKEWQPSKRKLDDSPDAASGRSMREVTVHIDEGQLDAMHALLQLMYSPKVPATASSELLLQMLQLADHYQATACTDLLLNHLVYQSKAGISACLLSNISSLPPHLHNHASYKMLLEDCHAFASSALCAHTSTVSTDMIAACRHFIIHQYQHVPRATGPQQRIKFCALPFSAVLAWAQSDQLQVHSENCVLYMLSAWITAQRNAQLSVSAAQLEQLAHQVRVLHLTPAYLHHVLPNLEWFKSCSSMQHLPTLLSYKGTDSQGVPVYPAPSRNAGRCAVSWAWQGAAQWVAGPRQPVAASIRISWHLGPNEVQQLCSQASVVSGSYHCNGFLFNLSLNAVATNSTGTTSTAAAHSVSLGMYHQVSWQKMAQIAGIIWPNTASVAIGSVTLKVDAPKEADAVSMMITNLLSNSSGLGFHNLLNKTAPTVRELLQPLLRGDQLHVWAAIHEVDSPC